MRISVFGLGHVGLVTAVMLAEAGHEVYGVDVDADMLALLALGRAPFVEAGLEAHLQTALQANRLWLTADGVKAVADSALSLVCVGTPALANGNVALDALRNALATVGAGLRASDHYHVVVVRSTFPPKFVPELVRIVEDNSGKAVDADWGFCVNPEFLREGTAIADFQKPPLVVIGQHDARAGGNLLAVYHQVDAPTVLTDCGTALLVKYVSNAWHALKIVFANEIGDVAARLGIDGAAVMEIMALDTQLNISAAYLKPGAPFGGSCLPKDLRVLVGMFDGDIPSVLAAILHDNDKRIWRIVDRAMAASRQHHIGVIGISFKPGTDDMRDSPWLTMVNRLLEEGAEVRIYDPEVSNKHVYPPLTNDLNDVLAWAECLVVSKPGLLPDAVQIPVIYGDGRCV